MFRRSGRVLPFREEVNFVLLTLALGRGLCYACAHEVHGKISGQNTDHGLGAVRGLGPPT